MHRNIHMIYFEWWLYRLSWWLSSDVVSWVRVRRHQLLSWKDASSALSTFHTYSLHTCSFSLFIFSYLSRAFLTLSYSAFTHSPQGEQITAKYLYYKVLALLLALCTFHPSLQRGCACKVQCKSSSLQQHRSKGLQPPIELGQSTKEWISNSSNQHLHLSISGPP